VVSAPTHAADDSQRVHGSGDPVLPDGLFPQRHTEPRAFGDLDPPVDDGELLVRELVDHQAAHAEQAITNTAAGAFRRLCEVIEAGQRDGAFRKSLDPRFTAISIIAQVAYFAIARPAVGLLLGHGTSGPPRAVSDEFYVHAEEFALAALMEGRST